MLFLSWKQLLDLDMTAEDQTSWLCHEIGQCYLKFEDYANANRYADIALQAACTHNQSAKKVEASLLAAYAASKCSYISMYTLISLTGKMFDL